MSKPIVWERVGTPVGVHVSALSPEQASLDRDGNGYVERNEVPSSPVVALDEQGTAATGMSWDDILAAGRRHEAALTNDGFSKLLGTASNLGGFYDDLGRPGVNYGLMRVGNMIGTTGVVIGGATATGTTMAGSYARGENLSDPKVYGNIVTTGVYQAGSSYVAAKAGLMAGAKTALGVAAVTGPAAPIAAPVAGVIVGLGTAIGGKYLLDRGKDSLVSFFHGK